MSAQMDGYLTEIFSNTAFYEKLVKKDLYIPEPDNLPPTKVKMPFVFVANKAFTHMKNLMKQFSKKTLTKEIIYNYRVSLSRRIVRNAFGTLASRFRMLLNQINICSEKTITIVLTCCYSHNLLRHTKVEAYVQGGIDIENMNTRNLINAD